ncbi:hypothetical protein K461DRAFT_215494, partial [Myriangium duriaei CBS 260.36]
DSPLDTANFLSFEEWKRKNLEKAGQSPEHQPQYQSMGSGRTDASGFSTSGKSPSQQTVRSKDAGRTCKERTNYASFDCAATVLKTNPECKSASSVLVENKDSYMLNICKVENKFFIVELCDAILIDTLVLANYEFFSSIFRTFRLSVSDRYPVKPDKWRDLGVFEAQNTRDVQAFLVEEPLIWARYLRIEILTHYGNQYYCPVSLLRVHGTTMMEEFRHQEELARGEYQEDEVLEDAGGPTAALPIPQEPPTSSVEADKSAIASSQPTKSSTMPHAGNENVKRPSHTTNGAQPVPSTQESFFKSIHKRLQMLESNATLSLQYIEEQSRILRDAFAKVEKRQVRKTERFLESLNATVNTELQSFRTEYDQLWQSTVIELETHRRMYQQEMQAVSSRLNLVAEELLFQKRMSIVQSTLLVLCVALVLFHR